MDVRAVRFPVREGCHHGKGLTEVHTEGYGSNSLKISKRVNKVTTDNPIKKRGMMMMYKGILSSSP
jgi:hypothetical protein